MPMSFVHRLGSGGSAWLGLVMAVAVATPLAAQTQRVAFKEAPALAAEVKAGRLPSLAERLPKEPLVVSPVERVGKHGGTWRSGLRGGNDVWLIRIVGYEPLVAWDRAWSKVVPNLAASWTVSADARTYTFKLRDGVRWSDGKPFTAHDVAFTINDLQMNKDWGGGAPAWIRDSSGEGPEAVAVDNTTLRLSFKAPHGLLLQQLATGRATELTMYQKEYCSQAHPKYNPDVPKLIEEAKLRNWAQLLEARCGHSVRNSRWNPSRPTLDAWKIDTPYTGTATQLTFSRNPYYWKVDTAGNQLPYIDRLELRISESIEDLTLRATAGQIDMMDRHFNTVANRAVLSDARQRGGYRFFETTPDLYNSVGIYLNQTHRDPALRQVLGNRDVRIALSHAINRQEIIDTVYVGEGKPFNVGSRPESPLHQPGLGDLHVKYDVAAANRLLDKAGLTRRDAQGFRLLPDGRRFSLDIQVVPAIRQEWNDIMLMVRAYWQAVGVDARVNTMDRTLYEQRRRNNEHDVAVWEAQGSPGEAISPWHFMPYDYQSAFGVGWAIWAGDPKAAGAVEPPDRIKRQIQLYREVLSTADVKQQNDKMKEIVRIAAEEALVIGISLPPRGYGIVKNNFRNVPALMPGSWTYPNPGPVQTSQFFIE